MAKNQKEMTFVEHLDELRSRLIVCLSSVLVLSVAIWFFSKEVLDFITRDVPKVYFTSVTEAFGVRIKICIWGGLIAGLPVILHQAWQFVVPGLLARETKAAFGVIFFGTLFFAVGGAFCFTTVLPVAVKFFLSFQAEKLVPIITVGDYVGFVAFMVFAFGAVFELPVVAFFLGKLGIVDAPMLALARPGGGGGCFFFFKRAGGGGPRPPTFFRSLHWPCRSTFFTRFPSGWSVLPAARAEGLYFSFLKRHNKSIWVGPMAVVLAVKVWLFILFL